MITNIINESAFYIIEESGEIVIDNNAAIEGVIGDNTKFENIADEFEGKDLPPSSNILRIEATLSANWSGRRSCSQVSVLRANVDRVSKSWIKEQLFEKKHLKFVRYGGVYANGTYHNGRYPFPNNGRWCNGSCTFPIFIEFTHY